MDKMSDLLNKKIGSLIPIELYRKKRSGKTRTYYLCICDCGNFAMVVREGLIKKNTKSCGCYKKIETSGRFRKHNMIGTKFYRTWGNMKHRILNPDNKDYKYYGGKGIKVDEKWLDFIGFKKDMYESYLNHANIHGEKNTTLDRIDGNGDYKKTNCRWATMQVQNDNKNLGRRPFIATNIATGETFKGLSLAEIGRELGIHDGQIGNVLKGKREQTCGYTFKYVDEIPI